MKTKIQQKVKSKFSHHFHQLKVRVSTPCQKIFIRTAHYQNMP